MLFLQLSAARGVLSWTYLTVNTGHIHQVSTMKKIIERKVENSEPSIEMSFFG